MDAPSLVELCGQRLWLSPMRAIYWEQRQALILSDMHLGKSGHFRKSGIAIPQNMYKEDLHRLVHLLQQFKPNQMIVVGDMFHSHTNKELDLFTKWRADFPQIQIDLVKGNHDILTETWYADAGIELHHDSLDMAPFRFVHDLSSGANENKTDEAYLFSGHIHPGVLLSGLGKQSMRLACFHIGKSHCTLPAFGAFTGLALIAPEKGDQVYAIAERTLIRIT